MDKYREKRNFAATQEPSGGAETKGASLRFVVQKHAASHLHYDFRLELEGVLKSWAVPKGPSLDPSVKRLSMMVEDHPFDYREFEGVIPKGNYGAGRVIVWDEGTYTPYVSEGRDKDEKTLAAALHKGDLKISLDGHKLKGKFALVKIRSDEENSWLLIKKDDEFSSTRDITGEDRSVITGRRIEEVSRDETPPSQPQKPQTREPVPAAPAQAERDPFPHAVKPMLATLTDEPFDGNEWLFEIKQDGYRTIAEVEAGSVQLYSRNNLSFTTRFAPIAEALASIHHDAVYDGEVVVLDDKGRSSFQLLQNFNETGAGDIHYFIFDLLYLAGRDLRNLPLIERKNILQAVIPDHPLLHYSDHVEETGKAFFDLLREQKLEGMIAKRKESRYQNGKRSRDWLKVKTSLRQEAIICGFTAPRGSRKRFGTLVLGAYGDQGKLRHIGHSGGGFDDRSLEAIHEMLLPLVQPASPFDEPFKEKMAVTWVRPEVVCEVAFSEWTDEGMMRHPVFLCLREDKDARSVVREEPATETSSRLAENPGRSKTVRSSHPQQAPQRRGVVAAPQAGRGNPAPTLPHKADGEDGGKRTAFQRSAREHEAIIDGKRLKLSNLNKVFWPEEGFTKGDVIRYYRSISKVMLPHLKNRPESLYRTPHGIAGEGFFQKEIGEYVPEWAATRSIYSESNDKMIRFLLCQDEATLVYMANLGCIEINPWLSRIPTLEYPDYFVIDLDPEDIDFGKVVEAALAVREILDRADIPGYPKTSGATGMHIYVPLGAHYDYDTTTAFARIIATMANGLVPGITSIERSPSKRQKKVYLDFLQNRKGQTVAAPYSVRPRTGATVSTPLSWDEVRAGLDPTQFTIETVPDRVRRLGDLFLPVLGEGIDMEKCLELLG